MSRRAQWHIWLAIAVGALAGLPASAQSYKELIDQGKAAMERGNYGDAEKAFRKAAGANKASPRAYQYLGRVYATQQRYADAAEAARKAIEIDDRDAWNYHELGTYLLLVDPEHPGEEAVAAFRRALAINKRFAYAAHNLGYALFKMQRYAEAAEALRQAVRANGSWAPYHASLGETLLYLDKPEEASQAFELAAADRRLKMLKDRLYLDTFSDIYLNWGKAEEKRGRLGTAKEHLRRLIDKLSDAQDYQRQVKEARSLLADIDRRLTEEAEARRKKQEEDAKKREDTKDPVVTITGTEPAKPGTTPADVQSRDLVIVAADHEETATTLVTGVASDDMGIAKVTVNGKDATLYQARDLTIAEELGVSISFSAEVAVKPGENRIEVVATDPSGKVGRAALTINGKRKERVEVGTEAVQEATAAAALDSVRKWAVLVGVNRYESQEISPLSYSVRDVRTIYDLLVDPKRAGFPEENVTLLTDDQGDAQKKPTRNNVYRALNLVEQNAKEEDLILVYYSGHGFLDKRTNTAYLLPLDTGTFDLEGTAIASDDFLKRIARIPANKKVIILDACHSGGVNIGAAKAESKLPDEWYKMLARAEGTVTIASCSAGEQSYEWREKQQGAFTHFLCEGLTGKADTSGDGIVSFQEVADYVVENVSQWARRKGNKQTPLTHRGNARFDIPLAAVRDVELEQKRQKLATLLADPKIQRYSIQLLEKEPNELTKQEQAALASLDLLLKGVYTPEQYNLFVRDLVATT